MTPPNHNLEANRPSAQPRANASPLRTVVDADPSLDTEHHCIHPNHRASKQPSPNHRRADDQGCVCYPSTAVLAAYRLIEPFTRRPLMQMTADQASTLLEALGALEDAIWDQHGDAIAGLEIWRYAEPQNPPHLDRVDDDVPF